MQNTPTIVSLEKFLKRLNQSPDASFLHKTPDGKAQDMPISYVESLLDELYNGLWSTRNFTTSMIANEVIGQIELEVTHPVTGQIIVRTGAGAIQLTMDSAPKDISNQEKNLWAQDLKNKKPNALDLAYPKLKVECIKNAAKGLGKVFGRDLNRGQKVAPAYEGVGTKTPKTKIALMNRTIASGKTEEAKELLALIGGEIGEERKQEFENIIKTMALV